MIFYVQFFTHEEISVQWFVSMHFFSKNLSINYIIGSSFVVMNEKGHEAPLRSETKMFILCHSYWCLSGAHFGSNWPPNGLQSLQWGACICYEFFPLVMRIFRVSSDLKNQEMSGNFFRVREIRENVRESAKIRHVREFYFASYFRVRETSEKSKNTNFSENVLQILLSRRFLPEFLLMSFKS